MMRMVGLASPPPGWMPPPSDGELLAFALEHAPELPSSERGIIERLRPRIRFRQPLSPATRLELERIAAAAGYQFERGEDQP